MTEKNNIVCENGYLMTPLAIVKRSHIKRIETKIEGRTRKIFAITYGSALVSMPEKILLAITDSPKTFDEYMKSISMIFKEVEC